MLDCFKMAGAFANGTSPMLLGLLLSVKTKQRRSYIGYCLHMTDIELAWRKWKDGRHGATYSGLSETILQNQSKAVS